ncbi:MAG: MazG family protein [Deinococcales bacterium]
MNDLLNVMRRLRGPGGCPWDQEQDHLSLRSYLLEEACEAIDALSAQDDEASCEELGDVLLQIAFHSVIAEERQAFSYANVEKSIIDKLIRRHPHVFGEVKVNGSAEVLSNWQAIKAAEKADEVPVHPVLKVPQSLPALARAQEVSKKLAMPKGDKASVAQALNQGDIGEMLLAVVNYARSEGINPEIALRETLSRHIKEALDAVE